MTTSSELPVIVTDRNGKILSINGAAHKICAALNIGDNIRSLMDTETSEIFEKCVYSSVSSFSVSLSNSSANCSSLLFDLTKSKSHGIFTVYPEKNHKNRKSVKYGSIAKKFKEAMNDCGFASKRRFAALYDLLSAKNSAFGSNYEKTLCSYRNLIQYFISTVLPHHLYFGSDLIYTEDTSVTDKTVIFAEPYSFYLILCAASSLVSHASNGNVTLVSRDLGDKTELTFSCICREKTSYSSVADFASRAPDLIFAESIANICGYEFEYFQPPTRESISFRISFFSHDYYPSYLKTDTGSDFRFAAVAESVRFPCEE